MKLRSFSRLAYPLTAAIAALLAAASVHATNLYWDTNGTGTTGSGAATGTWGSSVFWSTDSTGANVGSPVLTAATSSSDDLFFAAGTNGTGGTVTVSGTQYARSITFEESVTTGTTLNSGTINLGNATGISGMFFANVANWNINSAIVLNSGASEIFFTNRGNQGVTFGSGGISGSSAGAQTIIIGGPGSQGGTITFNGDITNGGGGGTVGVTVNGASTYTLAGTNSYTGATNILTGTLQINNTSTFTNTSAINLGSTGRLNVNAANASLAELSTAGGGSGVVAGSFLRFSQAQATAGASNGPGTIFGTIELNVNNANPNYTLDFGAGGALTNLIATNFTSPITLSGTASIDASPSNVGHTATYSTGGITASTAGAKTLYVTGSNRTANTISGNIGNGSGTIGVTKGGDGTWILSGTNTYTGNTRVDNGILQFGKMESLYNNTPGDWTAANINVKSGATLALNVDSAGTNGFDNSNLNTLITNISVAGSASAGLQGGAILGFDTSTSTGSTFTPLNAIANSTGANGGAIGLTKLGTGTLILDKANTYTGRTVISGGTLQLGNGGSTGKLSTSSTILNNGTLTINRSGTVAQGTDFSGAPIVGTGAFIQAGTSTTTLNAANSFSGTTTVSGGVLNLTNALALQNSALVTTGAGTLTLTGPTTLRLGGLSGASGDLGTIITSGYTGTVTALTLNPLSGSVTYGGVIDNGAMSLTKTGAGTQILSGANLYTGATIVNAGTLTVGSGATGSISSSSTLQMGGGIFNYSRTGTGQTVNGLTLNAGNSTVNNTSSGQTLTLGGITRTASVYGTVNFATLTGPISTTTGNTHSIIGPWATTGLTTNLRYAVGSSDGSTPTNISALTGTTATVNTLANVTSATGNYEYAAAVAGMGAGLSLTANTLRYSGAATTTAINATSTLTLNGLMQAGTNTLTISGGPTTGGILIGSNNELVITANDKATTISAAIADGGPAGRLVYSGAGSILTLSSTTSTYSGGTIINSGTISLSTPASGTLNGGIGTGPITVNSTGRLQLATATGGVSLSRDLTLNGGTLQFLGSGSNLTYSGNLTLAANSIIDITGNNSAVQTISGNVGGTGGITLTNSPSTTILGILRLNGTTNNYDGPTVVTIGGLTVKSSIYGNDTAKWTPANITVAGGAALMLNVAGSGEFTTTQAGTMFSQLATNVNNNGLQAGSTIGVDTRNAAAGTYTYSAVIADSTGAGGGAVNFKHTGASNTILELSGANTYSGTTIVDNGSTLRVSSFNSVFTNAALGTVHSASSSLGAPTTVANGTIHLGSANSPSNLGNSFQGGSLTYVGTGETTDRVISLNGGGNETYVLDQSGTGHLKFLSSFASGDSRAVKIITLQGSTAGTAELAGTIPNGGNGNHRLVKAGTGTWTLSGVNLYAGTTTINANGGTLQFAKQASLYNNDAASWTKTNIIVNSGGTLALNVGGTREFTTGNVTTLLTNLSTSINNNGLRSGSAIGFDTTNASGGTFTVPDTIANSTGTGSGAVGLTKLGTNTLVLTGPNTYTGATTVNAGTLLINGNSSTATGNVNVNAGTLGGTGTTGGAVSVAGGAILAPGASIESLAAGALTMASGSTFAYEVADSSASGADLLAVSTTVSLTGVNLSLDAVSLAALAGGGWTLGDKITLISYLGADITSGFTGYADDTSYFFGANEWLFDYNDTVAGGNYGADAIAAGQNRFVTMTVTAIPEPRTALLGGLGLLALLRRRRD